MKNITLVLSLVFIPFFAFAVNKTVGASGADYLTDGSNDEVEIQQAINYVSTNGGGTVTLLDCIYFVKGMDTEGSVFFQKIIKQKI